MTQSNPEILNFKKVLVHLETQLFVGPVESQNKKFIHILCMTSSWQLINEYLIDY